MAKRKRPPWPRFTGFEWDDANRSHMRRHSELEIEQAFFDPGAVVRYNAARSTPAEPRWLLTGRTPGGQQIQVVFTRGKRDPDTIRPITSWTRR